MVKEIEDILNKLLEKKYISQYIHHRIIELKNMDVNTFPIPVREKFTFEREGRIKELTDLKTMMLEDKLKKGCEKDWSLNGGGYQ